MSSHHSLLERFCDRWEEVTGLRICIYDLGYFTLANDRLQLPYLRRVHCSSYCDLVKSNLEAFKRCVQTESWRIEKASHQAKPFVHRCHAGVTDLIVPIRAGTNVVGAVFLGQCQPGAKERLKILKHTAEAYADLGLENLLSALADLPKADAARLKEMADIANFIADYVRQILSSVVTETTASIHLVRDDHGRILMEKVPNYFLDQLATSDGLMKQALQYLREGYWKEIKLPVIAKKVGLSNAHFSRVFRKTFGTPFRRCLLEARLSAAGWLSKKTDLKTKEIADLLGYADVNSLSRASILHLGVTSRSMKNRQPMPWHMADPKLMDTDVPLTSLAKRLLRSQRPKPSGAKKTASTKEDVTKARV
ncbi:MAG: PocR ligand-binding domain-containing protein [Opitutaceae bacterium]|jgi:ligand-binding sensor protein/AraC-like DNA-binding protein